MSNSGFPFSLDAEGGLCEGVENARGDFAAARPRRPPPHALRGRQPSRGAGRGRLSPSTRSPVIPVVLPKDTSPPAFVPR